MKLIINARPESFSNLSVVNGQDVIASYSVSGMEIEKTINKIFDERYIEAIQVVGPKSYTQKFVDYITMNHLGVEVLGW